MGWLTGWSRRAKCTIDGTVPGLTGAVSNGIAIVAVPAALKAVCQAAGQDLRFTGSDGTTLLAYGIEDWSVAAPICHVLVPTVATGNTIIYAYGGNAGAVDAQNKAGVATNYAGYWPLGDAGPANANDWTANGNHGTQSGGVTFGQAGKCDGACLLASGSSQYFSIASANSLKLAGSITLLAWLNLVSYSEDGSDYYIRGVLEKAFSVEGYFMRVGNGTFAGRNVVRGGFYIGGFKEVSGGTVPLGAWTHLAAVYNGAQRVIYVNGAAGTPIATSGAVTTGDAVLHFGTDYGVDRFMDGYLDGMGVAGVGFSSDYIAFVAKSFPGSAMFTWGALEALGGLLLKTNMLGNDVCLRGLIHRS